MSLHGLRFRTKLETPLFNALLVKELFAHILNLLHLILRSDSSLSQSITHASSLFDVVRYTINKAELRRQVKVLVLVLNKEQRLLSISNYHIVMAFEVLSDTDIFTLVLEFHGHRIQTKFNISDNISASVTPVSYHTFSSVFKLDHLLPVMLVLSIFLHLVNSLQARCG